MDGLLTQGNDEQKEVQLLSSQMQKTWKLNWELQTEKQYFKI
jgi:hypothetical protein